MERFLKPQIIEDLNHKMVFLAGPRQVGKTTLAKSLSLKMDYLNWDVDEDRTRILTKEFKNKELYVFDEIHKYKTWRNYLKGLFDSYGSSRKILVTGSARLDILRKGGDSLQGRYHFLRLMPLTFAELKMTTPKDLMTLYSLSGFPEPFFQQSKANCNRWSRQYRERIVRQEVFSNEQILDLSNMELLLNRLPDFVGGTLSINSLREDLQVSHKTAGKWIDVFEKLYAVFRISPFGPPKIKAIKKEQKIFFYDWNAVVEPGPRYENFLAVHIMKWISHQQDVFGRMLELRYFRDKYGHEVDFVVLENNKPILFIEARYADSEVSKGLVFLKKKFPSVRSMQLHLAGKKDYVTELGIEVTNVINYLKTLV